MVNDLTCDFSAADLCPTQPLSSSFLARISYEIEKFIDAQAAQLADLGTNLAPLIAEAKASASGGKRLRPAFCYWAYVGVAGQPENPDSLLKAAASLDLLHVSLLVHDDIIDAAETRRGRPASHRVFSQLHRENSWHGDAEIFGRSAAIILGGLLSSWHQQMLNESGLSQSAISRAEQIAAAMRSEVQAGQYLDILGEQLAGSLSGQQILANCEKVVEYKSGRYSVMRPLQLGAALGGADEWLIAKLAEFGNPLGLAFQYRDDLLGVFGDAEVTGKPSGDDIREGKQTVLIGHALSLADPGAARRLADLLGKADLSSSEVADARAIIVNCGAKAKVEAEIAARLRTSLAVLDQLVEAKDITDQGKTALAALAAAATNRAA